MRFIFGLAWGWLRVACSSPPFMCKVNVRVNMRSPPGMVLKAVVNNGSSTTNLNWCVSAGFLNHQQHGYGMILHFGRAKNPDPKQKKRLPLVTSEQFALILEGMIASTSAFHPNQAESPAPLLQKKEEKHPKTNNIEP